MNGLDSLKRHQKCMRTTTKALTAIAMSRSKNKTKAKRNEVKAAAAGVARVACAVTVGGGKRTKGTRKGTRRSTRGKRFTPPDFARQLRYEPPPPSAYDDNWGY